MIRRPLLVAQLEGLHAERTRDAEGGVKRVGARAAHGTSTAVEALGVARRAGEGLQGMEAEAAVRMSAFERGESGGAAGVAHERGRVGHHGRGGRDLGVRHAEHDRVGGRDLAAPHGPGHVSPRLPQGIC